jgi:HemY protein
MSEVAMPGGAQMLPLIVGAVEDKTSDSAAEVVEDVEIVAEDVQTEVAKPA